MKSNTLEYHGLPCPEETEVFVIFFKLVTKNYEINIHDPSAYAKDRGLAIVYNTKYLTTIHMEVNSKKLSRSGSE